MEDSSEAATLRLARCTLYEPIVLDSSLKIEGGAQRPRLPHRATPSPWPPLERAQTVRITPRRIDVSKNVRLRSFCCPHASMTEHRHDHCQCAHEVTAAPEGTEVDWRADLAVEVGEDRVGEPSFGSSFSTADGLERALSGGRLHDDPSMGGPAMGGAGDGADQRSTAQDDLSSTRSVVLGRRSDRRDAP